jgi:hypothetical protein
MVMRRPAANLDNKTAKVPCLSTNFCTFEGVTGRLGGSQVLST